MHSERAPRICDWRLGGVIFLHFPLLIIAIYAFNTEDAAFSFPPQADAALVQRGGRAQRHSAGSDTVT